MVIVINYLNYVNIKQGTKSEKRFSNGNTLPLVMRPFGMNSFTIQNEKNRDGWFYDPNSRSIEGIRLTHQPSPWMGDYGHLILMPQSGYPMISEDNRWSGFKPNEAILEANYMKIDFLRYRAELELTPTERGSKIRVTYRDDEAKRFALIPFDYNTTIKIDYDNNRVIGYTKAADYGVDNNFLMYFVCEFNKKIKKDETVITYRDGTYKSLDEECGFGIGINLAFEMEDSNELNMDFANSYIGIDQALLNLDRELRGKSFDEIKEQGKIVWNNYLSKIQIETDTEDQKRTFYSCMYRSLLFPRKFYEYDENEKRVHYSTSTGKVENGYMYTDNGFWDTFRSLYPLYSIIIPEEYKHMLEAFINIYKESGWLPRWISPGERGTMPGTLIDAVLADAIIKNIITGDLAKIAFEGMIKHSNKKSEEVIKGRPGIEDYLKFKYLPREKYVKSVNNTLDYVYGDFCIAQVAQKLGEKEIAKTYFERALWYENIFDKKYGFMRGRDSNNKMKDDFNPYDWGIEYCEGSAWQNSFAVYHDIVGLANIMGGKEKMVQKMDMLFESKPIYNTKNYGKEIHEITEMASVDFGQCAISNQPSFHIPYIYTCMGKPNKSNFWIRRIVSELFKFDENGFPGDEDNGSMSAWYILSSLGLYSFCPGTNEFVLCSPSVKKAVLKLENSNEFVIKTEGNMDNIYIDNVKKDGVNYSNLFINYEDIIKGTKLNFKLVREYIEKDYRENELPFSLSNKLTSKEK